MRGIQEVGRDPLQGEESFEAFDPVVSPVLTMQGKFSFSSITGPGTKHCLCCPPLECDNEGQRDREARGSAAEQPDLCSEFKAAFCCELEISELKEHHT